MTRRETPDGDSTEHTTRRNVLRTGIAAVGATIGIGSATATSLDSPRIGGSNERENRVVSQAPDLLSVWNPRIENREPESPNRTVLFDVENISDDKYVENGYVTIKMFDESGEQVELYRWPKTGMEIMPGEETTVESVVPDGDKWDYVLIKADTMNVLPAWSGGIVRHNPL